MNKTILFFDGECSLCNKTVQFVIKHEKKRENPILFCSLQSNYARQALDKFHYDFDQLSTFVLLNNNKIFYKSNAALNLCWYLKAPYSWLVIFKIVPVFIRDAIYNYIAQNRKRLIKSLFCYIPSPLLKSRFIE